MAAKEEKKSVLVRFDGEEVTLLDAMCQQDLRDRTNFIRLLVRQEADRRGLTKPSTKKP